MITHRSTTIVVFLEPWVLKMDLFSGQTVHHSVRLMTMMMGLRLTMAVLLD